MRGPAQQIAGDANWRCLGKRSMAYALDYRSRNRINPGGLRPPAVFQMCTLYPEASCLSLPDQPGAYSSLNPAVRGAAVYAHPFST
jgi:hypothetical protein